MWCMFRELEQFRTCESSGRLGKHIGEVTGGQLIVVGVTLLSSG